jgi:hypothetical protein
MLDCSGYVRFVAYSENINFCVICVWFVFQFESDVEKRMKNLQILFQLFPMYFQCTKYYYQNGLISEYTVTVHSKYKHLNIHKSFILIS